MRRLLMGAGLVAAVVAVAVSGSVAQAGPVEPPVPREVTVAPPPTSLVCPAPPALVTDGDAEGAPATDAEFDASPVDVASSLRAVVAPGTSPGPAATVMPGADRPAAAVPADGSLVESDGDAATSLVAPPAAGALAPPSMGAVHTSLTPAGDLRGLAATGCAAPAASGWLVGGATAVGRSARLLLANPGSTAGSVDLTVLTATGPLQPAAGQQLVLAPGEQREVLLEGLVPDADAVAVHYDARGAQVSAQLVTTRLDGLTPAGVEVVSPSAPPATRQVVPGLGVDQRTALSLRLAAPGPAPAVVRLQLHGADGPTSAEVAAVTVPAGTVVDVDLPAVEPGDYGLVVDAEVPVLAAVAVERGTADGPTDIAWAGATSPLAGASVVPLPADGDVGARLTLVAPEGAATVALVQIAADGWTGSPRAVRLGAGAVFAVDDLDDEAVALLVRAVSGSLHAATELTASSDGDPDDLVAVVGIPPAPVAAEPARIVSPPSRSWPGSP